MIRETVFVSAREVLDRPAERLPTGGIGHTAFTFPPATIIHSVRHSAGGLIEIDASFPEPAL